MSSMLPRRVGKNWPIRGWAAGSYVSKAQGWRGSPFDTFDTLELGLQLQKLSALGVRDLQHPLTGK